MAIILIAIWLGLLQLLVKLNVLKGWSLWMKISPALIYLTFLLIVAIPMNFIAPKGKVMVLRETVTIAPEVTGRVIEVNVLSNYPIQKGETLFTLNPAPYQAKVDAIQSQIDFTEVRLAQAEKLIQHNAGRQVDVEQFQAQLKQQKATLIGAQLDLDNTKVISPSNGVIPYIGLESGAILPASQAVMSLINTEKYVLGAVIPQNYIRHIKADQTADIIFKLFPGKTFKAKVVNLVQQAKGGQIKSSGAELDLSNFNEQPFMAILTLDLTTVDDHYKNKLMNLPAGAFGSAVIYTNNMESLGEKIQAIMLRTSTWMNYL